MEKKYLKPKSTSKGKTLGRYGLVFVLAILVFAIGASLVGFAAEDAPATCATENCTIENCDGTAHEDGASAQCTGVPDTCPVNDCSCKDDSKENIPEEGNEPQAALAAPAEEAPIVAAALADTSGVPQNISHTDVSTGRVKISWEPVPGATKYFLYQTDADACNPAGVASESGRYINIWDRGIRGTSYQIDVWPGESYWVKVTAIFSDGSESAFSAAYNFTAADSPVQVPTVTGTILSPFSFKLSFSPTDPNYYYSSYYVLRYDEDGKLCGFTSVVGGGTVTDGVRIPNDYKPNSVPPGTTHTFKIAYSYDGIMSNFSDPITITTPLDKTPITAEGISLSEVKLTWQPIIGSGNTFIIYRSTTPDGTGSFVKNVSNDGASEYTFTVTNLAPNTSYYYWVSTQFAGSGVSSPGYRAVGTSLDLATPNPSVNSATLNSLNLTWEAVPFANSYKVYHSDTANGTYTFLTTTTSLQYQHTGLSENTSHYYQVSACSNSPVYEGQRGSTFGTTLSSYTVTYNGNGSTGGTVPSPATFTQGQTVTVPSHVPTLSGYTFAGWQSSSDGKIYAAGQTFAMPAKNVTLTAQWKEIVIKTYTLTYNGNGNTGGTVPAPANYEQNTVVTVAPGVVRANSSFVGWLSSFDGKTYTAGQTIVMPAENVTLTAMWEGEVTYVIHHYEAGTTNRVAADVTGTGRVGQTITGQAVNVAYMEADAQTKSLTLKASSGANVLVFEYTLETYQVRFFDGSTENGGAQIGQTQNVKYGYSATAPAAPTREGYTFIGWDKSYLDVKQNTDVYALWQPLSSGGSTNENTSDSSSSNGSLIAGHNDPRFGQQGGNPFENITNGNVPLANFTGAAWSLLSLLLSIASLLITFVLFARSFSRPKTEEYGDETEEPRRNKWSIPRALAVIAGALPGILFLLLDDLTLPMVWVNKWTIITVVAFVVFIIAIVLQRTYTRHRSDVKPDESDMDDNLFQAHASRTN